MHDKSFLITGGTGSFGKTMLKALLETDVGSVTILSRDEEKQDALRVSLRDDRIKFRIGDIRDKSSVDDAMSSIDYVFHAAALKQVPSCEFFPMQALNTNVIGSSNVIKSAVENNVKSVVCLSTDKSVFPINSMGMTKALMEKVAQSAARELGETSNTTISCVRYGNVLCSRGSVIPMFVKQIKEGVPITLTVAEMTRFLMPLRESVDLVNYAFKNSRQGDLFIKKAAAASMADLLTSIKNIMNAPDHRVEIIGWRHGEKLFETLASAQELSSAEDLGEYWRLQTDLRGLNYKPYFSEGGSTTAELDDFNSHNTKQLTVEEIQQLLLSLPEFVDLIENKD